MQDDYHTMEDEKWLRKKYEQQHYDSAAHYGEGGAGVINLAARRCDGPKGP